MPKGEIGIEQSANTIGPELANTIRKVREDKNVKAIVLRVNSPGGSALTSDIIWREVELAKQAKPFIASMGNVAASGGYYISCAADTIVAEPTTLTGSIGIFGMFFSGEKLIKDKIGINTNVVKTNDHSDFGGSYPLPCLLISSRPLTDYEKNVLENYVNQGYETFLSRVMEWRGYPMSKLQIAIAQGRV
ncbi:MAG: S49 family peptidase [Odoribacter sp.]